MRKAQSAFLVTFIVIVLIGIFVLVQFTKTEEVTPIGGETQEEAAERAVTIVEGGG